MMLASIVTGQEYYFRQMPLDLDDDIQKIELLFQGTDQMIWMGTDQGLYSFDGTRYWKIERPVIGSLSVTTIAENPNGEIRGQIANTDKPEAAGSTNSTNSTEVGFSTLTE